MSLDIVGIGDAVLFLRARNKKKRKNLKANHLYLSDGFLEYILHLTILLNIQAVTSLYVLSGTRRVLQDMKGWDVSSKYFL